MAMRISPEANEAKKPEKPIHVIMARLWKHMGRHRILYGIGMALGFVDAACQTCIPLIFRSVLNRISPEQGSEISQSANLWPMLAAAAGLILVFIPAAYFFHVFCSVAIARMAKDMRGSLYQHVQQLSADFFHRNKVGEITQRLNHDLDTMTRSIHVLISVVWHVLTVTWAMIAMFWIDWLMALVFVGLIVVVTAYCRWYLPRVRRLSRDVRDAVGDVSATITEYVGVNELIKSFTYEGEAGTQVSSRADQVRQKTERFIWRRFIFNDTTQVLMKFFAPFVLLFVGVIMLQNGRIQYGDLVAFYGYWMMKGGAVNAILNSLTMVFTGLASADRLFEFYDETPMVVEAPDAKLLEESRGEIEFRNVVFTYPAESDIMVLDNISFCIEPGQKVAIVGPSGAGKSTILQLILRFYDPREGQVLVDGHDLRDLQQVSLRSQIGMVMQESVFMAGTIEENLRLGKIDATEAEMRQALFDGNALEFVDEFPNGLQTVLGERGVRLSGGQKQRLSIARVFLKNPPILLFDEATSSLDSLAEKQVQGAMNQLMAGRSTIIVAHRIATIQNADTILVLRHGKITQMGTHEELLDTSDLYQELCMHQQLATVDSL